MSIFFNAEDGYYSLTAAGMAAFIILIAVLVIITPFLAAGVGKKSDSKTAGKKLFSTKTLVFCAVALALGFAASYVQLIKMPWGGSVTLFSMLFVTLIGYWYGPKIGLICGFAYGILQFIQGGGTYILSPLQVLLDYIFAFAALGLSGFFYKSKNGLIKGYIFAIVMRGVFASLAGYVYWMDYMPENFPQVISRLYPICYNYAYILLEGAATIVILLLPPVKKAMAYGKRMAAGE